MRMSPDELFAANMAVFKEHFPTLHARIAAVEAPLSSLVWENGQAVDLDLGSGRLYRCDGRDMAREQAAAFLAQPAQVGYYMPKAEDFDSMISRRMHRDILGILIDHDLKEMPLKTGGHTGFFFIFGIGLGYHLPPLLEGLNTPHVVICEAFDEFLLASLRVVDWGALVKLCQDRKATLDVLCINTPEQMAARISDLIDKYGPIYLDGSYYYQHYALWTFAEAKRRLLNELPRQMIARGFFEDERKMLRNTATNFHKQKFRILTGRFLPRDPNIPVFVIGAGPSLDQAMPYIKEWRDHALVVSAGSGLQPCLKNGIIPDIHVEIENTYAIHTKLQHILDENRDLMPNGRFDGIRLVASSTLNPTVSPLFSDISYFLRDSACSSVSFAKEFGYHFGAAPTVANTAVGTLAHMGVGDIYLFGIDCGWRDTSAHHARDTIYYTSDELKREHMYGGYALPGNFGGMVQADMTFDWSRNMLEAAIAAYRLSVFNCSDGALIKGAIPKVAEGLNFEGEPLDREAALRTIFEDCPSFEVGEFFKTRPMTPYRAQVKRYQEKLLAMIDMAIAETWPFRQFHDTFWHDFVKSMEGGTEGMAVWVYYATVGTFKHACIFMNRIVDSKQRDEVLQAYYKLFRQIHVEMFDEVFQHLDQIEEWVAGGPEPYWTQGLPEVPGTSY